MAAVFSASLLSSPVQAQRPVRVAVLHVSGGSAGVYTRKAIEKQLESVGTVDLVPLHQFKMAARKFKIPSREWLTPDALSTIATELQLDLIVVGRLKGVSRWSYLLTAQTLDVRTLKPLATATAQFSLDFVGGEERPALSDTALAEIVRQLLAGVPLKKKKKPKVAAPPEPDPVEEDTSTGESDGFEGSSDWGSGSFDSGGTTTTPDGSSGEGTTSDGSSGDGFSGDGFSSDGFSGDGFSDSGGGFSDSGAPFAGEGLGFGNLSPVIGGRLGASAFLYPLDGLDEDELLSAVGRQEVEAALKVSIGDQRAKGVATLLARRDFAYAARDRFDIEEAYGDVTFGGLSLRAGRSFVTWGTANLFSPADIINPRDYRDIVRSEKWASWLMRVSYGLGPVSIEAYWLPVVEPHLLPLPSGIGADGELVSQNRWVRGAIDTDDADIPLRFSFRDRGAPPPSLHNTQAAARATLALFGVDASLGYAYMFERVPTLRSDVQVAKPLPLYADVIVYTDYTRQHLITGDFEYAFGKLRLAGEALVGITEDLDATDDEVADPFTTVVLGFDWQTGTFFETHSLHFFLEGVGNWTLGEAPTDPLARLRYPFPLSLLGRVGYNFGTLAVVSLNGIANFNDMDFIADPSLAPLSRYDVMVQPEVELLAFDLVRLHVAGLVLLGHDEGLFGKFLHNSRIEAGASVQF